MIDRLSGQDADLIIENRWPYAYNEDKISDSARHHREEVAAALSTQAIPHLQSAHREAKEKIEGLLADASAAKAIEHLRITEESTRRHLDIADHLDEFAGAVTSSKQRINDAVHTFTSDWAKAPQLSRANNWYQHDLSRYRTQLVDTGRATVTQALSDLAEAHTKCLNAVGGALPDQPVGKVTLVGLNARASEPGRGSEWDHVDDVMDFWKRTSDPALPAMPEPHLPEF